MKNRFLRFTFVVFLSGLTSVLMALSVKGNDGVSTDKTKKMTSSEYFNKIRSNQNTGLVPIADVLRAREESQAMSSYKSTTSSYNWTSMGPENFGGPTKAIIFDNQDASGNTLFAGSTSGGLWTSSNFGATWAKIQLGDVLNVSTICQASNGTIYVGTGVSLEPANDKLAEGSTIGKGIFKSTNGRDFQLMEGTAPSDQDANGDWAFIQKLTIDGSGNLYAATNTGLKYFNGTAWVYAKADGVDLVGKSCDIVYNDGSLITAVAGSTYVSTGSSDGFVLKAGEEEGMLPIGAFGNIKFAASTTNSNYIYASYVTASGSLHNVYLSTDKGTTWRVVYPGGSSISDIFNGQGLRNNSIAVDPTDEKVVYVGGYNLNKGYEAQPTGYYSWKQVTNGSSNPFPQGGETDYLHYGINTIVFHPSSAGNVIFGTDGGIGVTKNNFTSLQILNRNYKTTEYFTMNVNKSGTVIAGSQFNGVHLILDNGSSQAKELLGFRTPSPSTGGYNHISFINPDFYVCSSETGTFWRSEDAGENVDPGILSGVTPGAEFLTPFLMWETVNNPFSGTFVEFTARKDYNAGEEIWALSNNYDFPFKTNLEQRLDSGETALVQDLVSSRCFIAVEGEQGNNSFDGGVYMTTGMLDYTASPVWWQIGAVEGIPTCMAYSKDANYVWVGTLEGRLFRLSNISRANTEETASIASPGCIIAITEIALSTTQAITSIAVDPKNNDQVVFTLGNYGNSDYIFATTDGRGDSPVFESIQGNLPAMPTYASSFEVNNDGLVFIGTENGLFYTQNFKANSVNWIYEDASFENVPIFSIKQQSVNWPAVAYPIGDSYIYYPAATNFGAIYIGTFGAGAYVTKDFVGFDEPESFGNNVALLDIYPNPAQNQIHISYDSKNQGDIQVAVYDLAGKLILNKQFEVNKGLVKLDMDLFDLNNGSYILRLHDGQKQYQAKLVISK